MKPFAMFLCLLLLLPVQTLAQTLPQSSTPASSNNCEGLATACSRAAKELKAARALIEGYAVEIAAHEARMNIALQQIDSLRKLQMLSEARAQELETVIRAEREAKAALVKLKDEQQKRIKSLEKSLSRTRKFALIAGVAAGVAILIGARR